MRMKTRSLKLMLLSLLGLISTNVFAQDLTANKYFPYGDFIYKVITAYDPATETPGTVSIEAIRTGKNPVNAEGKLNLVGSIDATILEEPFKATVLYVTAGALQQYATATLGATAFTTGTIKPFDHIVDAKSIVIPKEYTTVQTGTFAGYTNVTSITFEAGSQLATVQSHAFTTTQTKVFDFSPCAKLYILPDEAFVETGLTNTYITTVTLPDHSADTAPVTPFTLGMSLKSLPSLTTINNLDKCNVRTIVADAFNGDASLESLVIPATVQTIQDNAFQASGIKYLTVNVDALTTFGNGTNSVYGTTPEVLETLTLKGVLNTAVAVNAFNGCVNLVDLNLDEMTFQPKTATINGAGQFAANSFDGCISLKAVVLPTLQGSANPVIAANAFQGCTALKEVTIKAIKSTNGGVGAAAFGNALKTVKIGTIDAGNAAVAAGAFVFGDVKDATLEIAQEDGEYLKSSAASLIGAGAFDFSAVAASVDREDDDYPTIKIGEIKSGNIFADGALQGDMIQSIEFTGALAANAIVPTTDPIILDNSGAAVTNLEVKTLIFKGNIAAGAIGANAFAGLPKVKEITFDGVIAAAGIAADAFANLTQVVTLTFNGELKPGAIAAGAFTNLVDDSEIYYTKTGITYTLNPFDKTAFKATNVTPRKLKLVVTDAALAAKYADAVSGLGSDGTFDIYNVIFEAAAVVSGNLDVYVNANGKTQAWAREAITATAAGKYMTITRVQDIDGVGEVKVTLYGTYTDEDPFAKQSTVYMVPLKAIGGVYYIGGVNTETLIAKVEKTDGSAFTADFQIPEVELTTAEAEAAQMVGVGQSESSIWAGLQNTKLHIAGTIMTNQQLNDGTAVNTPGDADPVGTTLKTWIDNTTKTEICRDLYFMSDPSKGKGFNIKKMPVTTTNGSYINAGWYYMLLAKFNDDAEARVIWLGEDENVTAILGVKKNVKSVDNDAVYTLQGVRVDEIQKGHVYIKNGKKFIAQ